MPRYREWGERCVERFNGMWAFVIWDARRRTLFCSRDRFGIKPFYYRLDGRRFVFASEPWALRRGGGTCARSATTSSRVSRPRRRDVLRRRRPAAARALARLRSATGCACALLAARAAGPAADAVDAVRETFLDAVRLQLRSDVPVGTCLSGGIDSSRSPSPSRTTATTTSGRSPHTSTTRASTSGRMRAPSSTGPAPRRTGSRSTRPTSSTDLPAIVEAQGEPFGSTSICAGWYVMREAKRAGLTVMLDGQGGDEILAGYRASFGYRLSDLLRAGS